MVIHQKDLRTGEMINKWWRKTLIRSLLILYRKIKRPWSRLLPISLFAERNYDIQTFFRFNLSLIIWFQWPRSYSLHIFPILKPSAVGIVLYFYVVNVALFSKTFDVHYIITILVFCWRDVRVSQKNICETRNREVPGNLEYNLE